MRTLITSGTCALALMASHSAHAEQPVLAPTAPWVTVGLEYGGRLQNPSPVRFNLLFAFEGASAARLPILEIALQGQSLDEAKVLGHEMLLTTDRLNESGESTSGSNNWIWWTLGGVVAAGAVASAAGGGGGSADQSQVHSNRNSCTIVHADPSDPQVGQGCTP